MSNTSLFLFLAVILTTTIMPARAEACIHSDLAMELFVLDYVGNCDKIFGDEAPNESPFGWLKKSRIVDSVRNEKFSMFSRFDQIRHSRASYQCEQTANLYLGFKDSEGDKICHIAWEPSRMLADKIRETHFKNYNIIAYLREEVSGKFGVTEIVRRQFCHDSGQRVLTHIWVHGPYIKMEEVDLGFHKMADEAMYPVQHIRIEQKDCRLD